MAYQPALDGVRAVAVTAVLLFHGGVRWMRGGYVGVSVFFTLSGFLITSLLIREHQDTGRVAAGGFYARRARRLLPASALCLLGVIALHEAGAWDQVAHLRADVWAAALQVFNWLRVFGSSSYADLLAKDGGQVSPLEHYWSLAIEEQFYWVWPVAFVGLAAIARRRGRPVLGPILAATAAFVALAPVIGVVWGPDAAYWATLARVGEILTGASAAALVAAARSPRWARAATPVCLALILAACALFPTTGGPAYHGWMPALSTVTALLLLGLQHEGPVVRLLSVRPLVALGTISYGVYLYHWPIFTLVDAQRLGRGGAALLAVRLALTVAVAIVSYHLVEKPIRGARVPVRPTLLAGAALTVLVLVAALLIAPTGATFRTVDDSTAAAAGIDPKAPVVALQTVPDQAAARDLDADRYRRTDLAAPTPSRPVRILVIGDSTAEATGGGLVRWAAEHPDLAQVTIAAKSGCGFATGGTRVFPEGDQAISPACERYATTEVPAKVRELRPDVVVGMVTAWDVLDQRFPGTGVEQPWDREYRRRIEAGYTDVTEAALDAGAGHVLWLQQPPANPFWNPVVSPQEDSARHGVIWKVQQALADREPDRVSTADLAWYLGSVRALDDHGSRPDGVHLSPAAARNLAEDWLGPVSLLVAQR
ncbi:MAG: acyltransferase family protein [Acidimicrobiales bacterium]